MSPPSAVSGGLALRATVTRVIDGDTVEVEFTNGTTDTVRLLGVDTPETTLSDVDVSQYGYDDTTDARDFAFNTGQEAKSYAKQRLSGEQVKVVMDPESDARGYYDRRLAYIFIDRNDFDRSLLQKGYARVYDSSFTQKDEYEDVQSDAQAADRGIWGYSKPTETETPTPTPPPTPTPESEPSDSSGGGSDLKPPHRAEMRAIPMIVATSTIRPWLNSGLKVTTRMKTPRASMVMTTDRPAKGRTSTKNATRLPMRNPLSVPSPHLFYVPHLTPRTRASSTLSE